MFVHYAPKNEQVLLLTFQNRSLTALIWDFFKKILFFTVRVWNAETNAVERRPSSVPVQKLMSSALQSLVPHSYGTENTNINVNSVAASSLIAVKT